ncbi:DUF262 domain-containing protein [Flavobacterium sp. FlaQc-52]|jgi:uncharacterized protein with ParB-like and HNH nuclease domain|uniref:DUF262 domain-containing protein n=1 Tax=Flavobacterium sp. FlaQc-52 TaxID=3374185 RepID=UPI0037581630
MNLGKPILEELFNKQIRFRIPVFQRHYVWNEQDQLMPLWEDFLNKYNERLSKKKIHPHYTGSIVLFHENTTTSTLSSYSVIDGQQRLTTFQIFIASFREVSRKYLGDESLIKELDKFLFNEKSFGDKDYEMQKYKLEPTKFNKEIFNTIISNSYEKVDELLVLPVLSEYGIGHKTYRQVAKNRNKLLGAYLFFYDQLDNLVSENEGDLTELITQFLLVLKRDFQFVEIGLTQNDDPQMIFETMNGRGASLTETDLIRNYIFMRANSNQENLDKIYENYWDEFDDPESKFKWHEKTSRGRYFESNLQFFVIDYLTLKLQTEIRYDQVFYFYKLFVINQANFINVEQELEELNRYSKIFKRLVRPDGNTPFDRLASRLIDMSISTIYPLILYIEGDSEIIKDNKNKIYSYLDSYITRRFLCGFTTKNYNNVFLEYLKFLTKNKDADTFKELLNSKTSETNLWPTDNILLEKLLDRPLYREEKNKTRSISNILLEVEKYIRGSKQEQVVFLNTGLTIEHLLPQNWFEYWPLDGYTISDDDFKISVHAVMTETDKDGKYHKIENRNKMLHTIGNLTILTSSLNPSVSNSSFDIKKQEIGLQSTVILNTYFQDKPIWNEEQIKNRSQYLYDQIKKIWTA